MIQYVLAQHKAIYQLNLPHRTKKTSGTLRWFTAGGAIRIAVRQLFCKTGNYVIYDVIIWVQDGNCKKWLERILVLVHSTI